MSPEIPKIETPKLSPAEAGAPTVEAEGGSRVLTLAVHGEEQERREAILREGGVIVKEPGIAKQDPDEAQRDRETAEAKELARREKFFSDLIAKFPSLTDVQREAVRATMEREKARAWSDYDGDNVQILRIAVEESLLTIVVDVKEMYTTVHLKVSF